MRNLILLLAVSSFSSFSHQNNNNSCHAFTTVSPITKKSSSSSSSIESSKIIRSTSSTTMLQMGLDMVTSLRCEWISAALCTNQTPLSANDCLILGCDDGRAVTFIPRTIETLYTSTLEADGILPVTVRRQLKQQEKNRGTNVVEILDQRADDLKELEDESVDIVLSLTAAAKMKENGLDWKKSIQEAARVLRPGGRFLCVEQSTLDGESYLDYVGNLGTMIVQKGAEDGEDKVKEEEEVVVDDDGNTIVKEDEDEAQVYPTFECMGYDDVDLVLVPHVATVFVKSEDAGITSKEKGMKEKDVEEDRMADLAFSAFERGLKKRKRKKKKKDAEAAN
jgi:SAM-dependent methyltransferase